MHIMHSCSVDKSRTTRYSEQNSDLFIIILAYSYLEFRIIRIHEQS